MAAAGSANFPFPAWRVALYAGEVVVKQLRPPPVIHNDTALTVSMYGVSCYGIQLM